MDAKQQFLGLDIGGQRIGVAQGDSIGRIAQPLTTVSVDGQESAALLKLVKETEATDIIVGRPRNQSGDKTQQTQRVEEFVAARIMPFGLPVHWQDESVTSVIAEERLQARKKPYNKGDIDAEAAAIILQDYLEQL